MQFLDFKECHRFGFFTPFLDQADKESVRLCPRMPHQFLGSAAPPLHVFSEDWVSSLLSPQWQMFGTSTNTLALQLEQWHHRGLAWHDGQDGSWMYKQHKSCRKRQSILWEPSSKIEKSRGKSPSLGLTWREQTSKEAQGKGLLFKRKTNYIILLKMWNQTD